MVVRWAVGSSGGPFTASWRESCTMTFYP